MVWRCQLLKYNYFGGGEYEQITSHRLLLLCNETGRGVVFFNPVTIGALNDISKFICLLGYCWRQHTKRLNNALACSVGNISR